jgi:hypothetical protein
MKREHLHLLINEEIFSIESDQLKVGSGKTIDTGQTDAISQVKIAFIHNTLNEEELVLLNNIISACKIESSDYQIMIADDVLSYQKAIIFTDSVTEYYIPVTTETGEVIYSKPLKVLNDSKEEKGKLWNVLKDFFK